MISVARENCYKTVYLFDTPELFKRDRAQCDG
jgi:hypothetical protein